MVQTSANNSTRLAIRKIFDILPIFNSVFDFRLSNSTMIHQIYYSASIQLRSRTFSIHLDNESLVGTPLRRNLKWSEKMSLSRWDHIKKYIIKIINCCRCFSDGVASRSPHRPSSSRNRKVDRVQDLSPGIHVTESVFWW